MLSHIARNACISGGELHFAEGGFEVPPIPLPILSNSHLTAYLKRANLSGRGSQDSQHGIRVRDVATASALHGPRVDGGGDGGRGHRRNRKVPHARGRARPTSV